MEKKRGEQECSPFFYIPISPNVIGMLSPNIKIQIIFEINKPFPKIIL